MNTELRSAEIVTFTADIAIMRVNRRHLPLAVFRQIPRVDLGLPNGSLREGELWGTVNYHPDKCHELTHHMHVVWKGDGELRRATHYPPAYPARSIVFRSCIHEKVITLGAADRWFGSLVASGWKRDEPSPSPTGFPLLPARVCGCGIALVNWAGGTIAARASDDTRLLIDCWRRPEQAEQRFYVEARDRLLRVPLEAAEFELRLELEAMADRYCRQQDSWQTIEALPQLYIAV